MKIHDPQKVWFTSDTHYNHANIIRYCNRPFQSAEEMNAKLVENWNDRVKPEDTVFHLGDFAFGKLTDWEDARKQLNGKIILIKGNHDKIQDGQIKHLFDDIYDYLEIKVKDSSIDSGWQPIILCHYAFRVWNNSHRGAYHLYGHSHGTLPDDPCSLSFDVGVDCHNYAPLSYSDVQNIMGAKNWTK